MIEARRREADTDDFTAETPAGPVVVSFSLDDDMAPPSYAGDALAIQTLHLAIDGQVADMGVTLTPATLTPRALVELIPAAHSHITVTPPAGYETADAPMPETNDARRVITLPRAMLDAATAAQRSVADMRAALSDRGAGVLARLTLARELLSRFVASNPEAGNDDAAPRRATAHLFDYDDARKPAQRKRENRDAEALLARIDSGEVDAASLTDAQKSVLARYSGLGGALVGADGKKGSAYEYYTPKPIAEGVWNLMAELGFAGGKVLDPSAGTGVFGATAPLSAAVDAIELSRVSGRINGLVNGGPGYTATVAPFERVAAATPDETYDAVVTNVPFGGVADRGGNQLLDPRYQREPLQNYFILRSLEKLRPGGLAVFIVPPRCVSGKGGKEQDLRVRASYMAEFLGAYRLPNSVFGTAAADTITDVIAFRKYGREALEKIEELRAQSPDVLVDANVQWQPFIEGTYFADEGRRFILGEVEVGKGQWGDVERVVTSKPVGEVAKMLRRFPESRVDWQLIDATPTDPLTYNDGDTITQAGQTLEFRDGRWHALAAPADAAPVNLAHFTDPYASFEAGTTFAQAAEYVTHMVRVSQSMEIPDWVRGAVNQLERLPDDAQRTRYWRAGVIGMAARQVLDERMSEEVGVNYAAEYPALSQAMQSFERVAKNRPGALTGKLREGLGLIATHVRKGVFSDVWQGKVAAEVARVDVGDASQAMAYEGLLYRTKSKWVDRADAAAIMGEHFDPLADPAWCVSADGQKVARTDDYFIGNVRDVMEQLDRDIAAAGDTAIKGKLLWQKSHAATRYHKIDVRGLNYSWATPFVTIEEKLEFARRYVHESAYIDFNEKDGSRSIKLDLPSSMKDSDKGKMAMRLSHYLSAGVVGLASAQFTMKPGEALAELRRQVASVNQQFNGWVRGNPRIMARMEAQATDESKLRFRQLDDETPLAIPGFKMKLHGYQSAFVRRSGREFGGINGFGVGLGKTFTALAATQYAQAIGVKSKTCFVVPNSVLSNWRKEVGRAFDDTSDCLFIGLREKRGRAVVDAKFYDEDLTAVLTNKHRKVFMSMEAFERIKLRAETIEAFERHMGEVDKAFTATNDVKDEEVRKSKVAAAFNGLHNKIGAAPYLEDMGFDSLVIDEGHGYKNSTSTVDFKQAKFLSLPDAAKRGVDMQAKAWYVRGASPLRDGVMPLTATPITNSPLEIYSMLSLAAGFDRVNDMCLGVRGADDFMEVMTQRDNIDDVTIDGEDRKTDVFVGLQNVDVLRAALGAVATIKEAADVGAQVQLPQSEVKADPVVIPQATQDRLRLYKDAFRFAIMSMSGGNPDSTKLPAFDAVSKHFDEPMGTIANAFNLVNKMELLILDPDLDMRVSSYLYPKAQEAKVARVVDAFNQKKRIEERPRMNPHTDADAVVGRKVKKDSESGEQKEILRVHVRAKMVEAGRVLIDSIQPAAQEEFESMLEAAGVELDVTVPPKLAAMLENIKNEAANPRGVDDEGNRSPIVKQIIFCDRLGLHSKIKRLLATRAGIPASKIAVVTGQSNNKPDEILAVQDGFNAHGEENRYQIILANEKAEVGINLQKGTQAIHHVSIGWTPDSLTQRNGRGVRQGNRTGMVNVYYYDAAGTFDAYRRGMVNKKSTWIDSVLSAKGGNTVDVAGGLSDKQYEALINSLGDNDAMSKIEREVAEAERAARVARDLANQQINAEVIVKNIALAKANADPVAYIKAKIVDCIALRIEVMRLRERSRNATSTESARAKNAARAEELAVKLAGMSAEVDESCTITPRYPQGSFPIKAADLSAKVLEGYAKRGDDAKAKFDRYASGYTFAVREGSPLHDEWRSEVDMATSMAREAAENFERLSAREGAIPAPVAKALLEGAGWVWNGRVYTVGSFVRIGSQTYLIESRESARRVSDNPASIRISEYTSGMADVVLPGTAEHEVLIAQAAAVEDAIATEGGTDFPLSDVLPAIAALRKVRGNVAHEVYQFRLPAPHFPFVIDERAGAGALVTEIKRQQAEVVLGFKGYPACFVTSADQQVIAEPWAEDDKERALFDYAKALGVAAGPSDFAYRWSMVVRPEIERHVKLHELRAALANSGDPVAAASAFVIERVPHLRLDADRPDGWMPYGLMQAIRDAQAQAQARTQAQAQAPSATGASGAQAVVVDEIVAITGDTRTWKDRIKEVAKTHGNGRFRWDGAAAVWNVYRSAWDRLLASYPEAGQALSLTKPTITRF